MDVRQRFENLVKNKFMHDFEYYQRCFSFRTLFYSSAFSYRFCSCGYEHENIEYISPSDVVNETMYEKIVQCIIDGKCQHVDGEPEDHVAVTKVYGIHVAVAAGTERAVVNYDDNTDYRGMEPVGLFGVHPCAIAISKNKCGVLCHLLKRYPPIPQRRQYIVSAQRLGDDSMKIQIVMSCLLELCIRQNCLLLLKRFLQHWIEPLNLTQGLEVTIKHDLPFMKTILLEHIKTLVLKGRHYYMISCAESTIVFNKPDILLQILQWSPSHVSNEDLRRLFKVCLRLERYNCAAILRSFRNFDERDMKYGNALYQLLLYLESDYAVARDEIKPILNRRLHLPSLGYKVFRYFEPGTKTLTEFSKDSKRTLKLVFEHGADINMFKYSPLKSLLRLHSQNYQMFYKVLRELIEFILGENPDLEHAQSRVEGQKDILDSALRIDLILKQPCRLTQCLPGEYVMDNELHTYSRHTNYALHFIAPLFIECGLKFKKEKLSTSKDRRLHSAELEYLRQCADTPRSLKKRCRDVLRKHYIGRKIHAYVAMTNVPTPIRNFILLKDVLLM